MALTTRSGRSAGVIWAWAIGILLFLVFLTSCWYAYRWYMEGEEPPITVPLFVTADPDVDETEVTAEQIDTHTVPAANPRYVSIPSLGITNTRVFAMGVGKDNSLLSPANISDAAWYDKSATPGSGGVVLMNAHNGGVTRNGVFAKLGTLSKGEIIEIERGDGQKFHYEVRENQSMPLEEVRESGMKMMTQSAEPGKEALNLITCDGKWVPRFKQFDRRIMLRAVLVE